VAGIASGCYPLPASALLKARPKRASGYTVNAATRSEADLQLCYIARRQEAAAARLPTLATSAVL